VHVIVQDAFEQRDGHGMNGATTTAAAHRPLEMLRRDRWRRFAVAAVAAYSTRCPLARTWRSPPRWPLRSQRCARVGAKGVRSRIDFTASNRRAADPMGQRWQSWTDTKRAARRGHGGRGVRPPEPSYADVPNVHSRLACGEDGRRRSASDGSALRAGHGVAALRWAPASF